MCFSPYRHTSHYHLPYMLVVKVFLCVASTWINLLQSSHTHHDDDDASSASRLLPDWLLSTPSGVHGTSDAMPHSDRWLSSVESVSQRTSSTPNTFHCGQSIARYTRPSRQSTSSSFHSPLTAATSFMPADDVTGMFYLGPVVEERQLDTPSTEEEEERWVCVNGSLSTLLHNCHCCVQLT